MKLIKRCKCPRPCDHPWWYRFQLSNVIYRETTRTANESLARVIAHKRRDQLVAQAAGVRVPRARGRGTR